MPAKPLDKQRPHRRARDAEVRRKRGRDEAHRLRVETVHEYDRTAQQCDEQLITAERALVDEPADLDDACVRHADACSRAKRAFY